MIRTNGSAQRRRFLASSQGFARLLPAFGAFALLLAACVAGGPATVGPSTSPNASGNVDASASASASRGPSGLAPAPSNPLRSTGPAGTAPTDISTGGAQGGVKSNPLIVCIGPDQGPPCVQAAEVATVVAAETALSSASRPLIGKVTVEATHACPASAPAVACGATATPVAIVTFDRLGGATLGRVFVYRTAAGQLEATLL